MADWIRDLVSQAVSKDYRKSKSNLKDLRNKLVVNKAQDDYKKKHGRYITPSEAVKDNSKASKEYRKSKKKYTKDRKREEKDGYWNVGKWRTDGLVPGIKKED